jgi:hypothetical protein
MRTKVGSGGREDPLFSPLYGSGVQFTHAWLKPDAGMSEDADLGDSIVMGDVLWQTATTEGEA